MPYILLSTLCNRYIRQMPFCCNGFLLYSIFFNFFEYYCITITIIFLINFFFWTKHFKFKVLLFDYKKIKQPFCEPRFKKNVDDKFCPETFNTILKMLSCLKNNCINTCWTWIICFELLYYNLNRCKIQ